MSDTNVYGRIVSPLDVEQAVTAALNLWMDDYLGEAERLFGYAPNSIERPRGIVDSTQWDKWPEDQIPVILVVNAGLSGPPVRRAGGTYDAAWSVGISPIVSDTDQAATRKLMFTYVTAVKLAILQHKRLISPAYPNGLADFTSWRDETYTDMPFLSSRSMAAGRVVLEIGVENVLTEQAGPRTPTMPASLDPGALPTASKVTVSAQPLSATEAVR